MKVTANLFIKNDGSIRVTKKDTGAYPTELAVQLVVDVPDIFFKRPMPIVNLQIPEAFLINPDQKVTAQWIAPEIAEALKVDVKAVEDGLIAAVNAKKEQDEKQNT